MSIPSVPQIFIRPDAIDQSLRFFWDPPLSDGGSPVTSYFLTNGTLSYDISSTQLSYQVSGLTNVTPYSFTLAASNINGLSPAASFRTVQPGFSPSNITSVSSIQLFGTKYNMSWQTPATTASILGYVCKAYPVDSNYSTVLDSISTLTKPVNNRYVLQKDIELSSNVNWRVGVSAVNDPGYSVQPAFTSTLFTATDPKGSIYYSGSGSKLATVSDSDLNLGTSSFTIEWWQSSNGGTSFYNGSSPNYTLAVVLASTSVTIYLNGTSYSISNVNPLSVWHHFVLQRSGNVFTFFIDGTLVWIQTISITLILSGNIVIADGPTGYITNFHWIKGTAVYSQSGFLPPRINFSTVTNTKLLLKSRTYEYIWTDSSSFYKTVTPTNITWSNYVPPSRPFGSIYFSKVNKTFVQIPNANDLMPGTSDFSVEFFIYASSVSGPTSGNIAAFEVGNYDNFMLSKMVLNLGCGGTATTLFYNGSTSNLPIGLSLNQWTHIVLERYSGNMYTGIGVGSTGGLTQGGSFTTNFTSTTDPLNIGYPISTSIGNSFRFDGAITNFKWMNGRAPYASTLGGVTGSYTVPTRNISPNSTFTQALLSVSDSNSPYFDYSKDNRTILTFSTLYSTINPFSNY